MQTARALVAVLGLAAAVLLGAPASGAGAAPGPPGRDVVVVGVPGLSWRDVTEADTPALWGLADGGAVTNLNVRSTYYTSCPVDGWLGLSAGDRAAQPRDVTKGELRRDPRALPDCGPVPTVPETGGGMLALTTDAEGEREWRELGEQIRGQGFDARIGRLAQRVDDAGSCLAIGGAGAPLAGFTEGGPFPEEVRPAAGQGAADAEPCPITLVGAEPITEPEPGADRLAQVRAADAVVAEVTRDLPDETLVLVAGLSDDGGEPGLRVLLAAGGGVEPGWLRSGSTTRTDMGQVADVTYTALHESGVGAPDDIAGRLLQPVPDDAPLAERRQHLVDDDDQLVVGDRVIPTFFRTFGVGLAVLLAAAAVAWRVARDRGRHRLAPAVAGLALGAMALPAATFAATRVPWWRAGSPGWALAGVVAAGVVVVVAFAVLVATTSHPARLTPARPAREPRRDRALAVVMVLAAVTAGLLALDLLLDEGRMTMLGVLGLRPLDGGRFHGFGNVPFALFATSALLVATAAADPFVRAGRRRAAAVVAGVIGLLTFAVDAAPWLGADGGGALALIPAVGYLVLALAGVRIGWRLVLGLGAATVGGFLLMAWLDWLRPEASRTHLGRFFQRLLDGEAVGIVLRKLETNVDLLLGPERTALLVPVGLVLAVVVLARPGSRLAGPLRPLLGRYPALRPGLVAIVVALTAGFLLNDSGTAIPAVAAIVLLPALVALGLLSRGAPAAGGSSAAGAVTEY